MRFLPLCILLLSLQGLSALNILAFFPLPWRSHQFVIHALAKGLANKGHQVDLYTPIPVTDSPPGLKEYLLHDTLEGSREYFDAAMNSADTYTYMRLGYNILNYMVEKSMTTGPEVPALLRSNETYDVVLTEYIVHSECLAYIAHKFKAVSVAVAPLIDHPWVNELTGLPDNPSYMLSYMSATNVNMNLWQRIKNVYTTLAINLASYHEVTTRGQDIADRIIRYDGWESRPPLMEMVKNVSLVLTNSHPSMNYPNPKAPHVKEIGGIHIRPTQPLPKDLKDFMDNAPHGVIYFSFGTNLDVKTMKQDGTFQILMTVFRQLKQKVLWKVDDNFDKVDDEQIKMKSWFPQQDVLAHENLVLYITHGGLQSSVEAINHGVPIVGIPVTFDQFKDVEYLVWSGMGVKLSRDNITESSLLWSISEVVTNPKYRRQSKIKSQIFKDRPMKPIDEAAYWIEYVGKYGNILQPASVKIPFYQLYLLDVIFVFAVLSLIGFWFAIKICRLIFWIVGYIFSAEMVKQKIN